MDESEKYILNSKNFIIYKFFNSLFMGTSIGSIFVIYSPIEPSFYSIGGIVLAVGMILIATQYAKILNTNYFYKISLFVELVILIVILSFLYFSYSYQIALCVYIGYQITFIFGSYLGRGETLLLKKESLLKSVDISKQSGYLAGLFLSYVIYLFIGIQPTDINERELNLSSDQIELIEKGKNNLLVGFEFDFNANYWNEVSNELEFLHLKLKNKKNQSSEDLFLNVWPNYTNQDSSYILSDKKLDSTIKDTMAFNNIDLSEKQINAIKAIFTFNHHDSVHVLSGKNPSKSESLYFDKVGFSEKQKSAIKYIISQNQVYYLHYVLLIIELLVLIFLVRSFVQNKEIS